MGALGAILTALYSPEEEDWGGDTRKEATYFLVSGAKGEGKEKEMKRSTAECDYRPFGRVPALALERGERGQPRP